MLLTGSGFVAHLGHEGAPVHDEDYYLREDKWSSLMNDQSRAEGIITSLSDESTLSNLLHGDLLLALGREWTGSDLT